MSTSQEFEAVPSVPPIVFFAFNGPPQMMPFSISVPFKNPRLKGRPTWATLQRAGIYRLPERPAGTPPWPAGPPRPSPAPQASEPREIEDVVRFGLVESREKGHEQRGLAVKGLVLCFGLLEKG